MPSVSLPEAVSLWFPVLPMSNRSQPLSFPLNKTIVILAAAALILLGVATLTVSAHKQVHLIINGKQETKSTFAFTVGGFLHQQQIPWDEEDVLYPPPQHVLRGQDTIVLQNGSHITVRADQETTRLVTTQRKPANILAEGDIPLFPQDRILVNNEAVEPDHELAYHPQYTIDIERATPVTVFSGTDTIQFTTHAPTLAQALWEEGIPLYEGDQLVPPAHTELQGKPLDVDLQRSRPINVTLPTRTMTGRTTADTVGGALAELGLTLQGRDYSTPGEDQPIPSSGNIQVTRVTEDVILQQEPIPFTNTYQAVNDLEIDQRKIVEGGQYGLKASRVRVVYEDGVEKERITEKEWTAKEPQPRVIGYGTKIVKHTENTRDGQIQYWRKITAYATSYDETCPGCDDTTYSGAPLKKGSIAVTRDWYQYMAGLRVYIPGYGFGRIEDIGAGVVGEYWVDLGYRSENYKPWNRNVDVYFLWPPPSAQNIMYVLY